jgi:RNA polymerase sigma-70 factor, ECF subfamily
MLQHDDFHDLLVAILPRLRVQATALTRNPTAAEDVVQDAVANALAARDSFTPGTNFGAWMHRILYNRFISTIRKRRETSDLNHVPEVMLGVGAGQEHRLVWSELRGAIARLPPEQRATLLMVALEGMAYEEVAEATGCAVGTAKSRVFRARCQLQAWLMGDQVGHGSASRRSAGAVGARRDEIEAAPTTRAG